MRTFGLSCLVATGTFVVMWVVGLVFFTGAAIVFPITVAWVAASVFAFERRPNHLWLHVAGIGIVIATLFNLYVLMLPRLYPPPPGVMQGGPNIPMPAQPIPSPK
jgi:hypothetical protein